MFQRTRLLLVGLLLLLVVGASQGLGHGRLRHHSDRGSNDQVSRGLAVSSLGLDGWGLSAGALGGAAGQNQKIAGDELGQTINDVLQDIQTDQADELHQQVGKHNNNGDDLAKPSKGDQQNVGGSPNSDPDPEGHDSGDQKPQGDATGTGQGHAGQDAPNNSNEAGHGGPPAPANSVGGNVQGALLDALHQASKKQDWDFCSSNSDCANNCCSATFSDDHKLKCTPNGCGTNLADTVRNNNGKNGDGLTGNLGDWEYCSVHLQCKSSCCSAAFSDDGKLKCTPGGC